jgi:aldehyde:ferredoxin oxidoreductase
MCYFANVPPMKILDLVNEATGWDFTLEDLLTIGDRAWNLKRVLNNHLGLSQKNDKLPKALLQPYTDGGAAGYIIPFDEMMQKYYQVRGWNPKDGKPTAEKLLELGLNWSFS